MILLERLHTVAVCIVLVAAVFGSGCATTPSPIRGTEIASELRPPPTHGVSNEMRAQQLFVRGLTQAQIGNHGAALDLYGEALHLAPNTAAMLAAAAESHAALGDQTSAIYNARKAREAEPENIYYHFQLAQLHLGAEQASQAAEIYNDLRARYPNNAEVLYELARVHSINGDYAEAVSVYQRLLEEIGDDRDIQTEILHLYTRMGDIDGMERTLENMLTAHPHDVELRKMLSDIYLRQGNPEAATDQLERAVADRPGDAQALVNLAELYRELGMADSADAVLEQATNLETTEPSQLLAQAAPFYARAASDADARRTAAELLERVLEIEPSNSDALLMLGDILVMNESYKEGAELLYRSLQSNPRDPQIWIQAASAYLQARELERAAAVADEGLLLFPGSLPLLRVSGYALLDAYRNREAAQRFETAVRIIREDESEGMADLSELHSALGLLYDRMADPQASDAAYELALEADPNNAGALNNYAYSLAEREARLDEALAMARQAVELHPASASFHDTLGWVHFKLGDYEAALRSLQEAAQSGDASATVFEHLGDVHAAAGNASEARSYWQQALEMNPESDTVKTKLGSQ